MLFESETKPKGHIWNAIRMAGEGIGVPVPELNYSGVLPDDELEATIQIKQKGNGNSELIDVIANSFRHSEEVPVTLRFRDGSTLTRTDYKISQKFQVESSSGIPFEGDIFAKTNALFSELVSSGQIEIT